MTKCPCMTDEMRASGVSYQVSILMAETIAMMWVDYHWARNDVMETKAADLARYHKSNAIGFASK